MRRLFKVLNVRRFDIYYDKFKRHKGDKKNYINYVRNFECDVIIFECSQCITTDLLLPYLSEMKQLKIIHSHGFSGLTLKLFQKDSNLLSYLKNTFNWIKWRNYYLFKFKKYVGFFDIALCLSEVDSSINYLKRYVKNVYILSNAADDMFFKCEKTNLNPINQYITLKNKEYVISIANYQKYKNQIGILEQFYKSSANLDMIFIGSSNTKYYNELCEKNEELKRMYPLKKVHLLTNVKRKDIPQILLHSKIYLVGSTFEEFSISLIEAMAVGVPFISTNVGNAKLLPGGITLQKIEQMNKVIDMLNNDTQLYTELSQKGKVYARDKCQI